MWVTHLKCCGVCRSLKVFWCTQVIVVVYEGHLKCRGACMSLKELNKLRVALLADCDEN